MNPQQPLFEAFHQKTVISAPLNLKSPVSDTNKTMSQPEFHVSQTPIPNNAHFFTTKTTLPHDSKKQDLILLDDVSAPPIPSTIPNPTAPLDPFSDDFVQASSQPVASQAPLLEKHASVNQQVFTTLPRTLPPHEQTITPGTLWKPDWQQDLHLPSDLLMMIEQSIDKAVNFDEFFDSITMAEQELVLQRQSARMGKPKKIPSTVHLEEQIEKYVNSRLPAPVTQQAHVADVLPFQKILLMLNESSAATQSDLQDEMYSSPEESCSGHSKNVVQVPQLPTHMVTMNPLELALYYFEKRQVDLCFFYLTKAASLHDPLGLLLLSTFLRNGWGCPRDPVTSFATLTRAAKASLLCSRQGIPGSSKSFVPTGQLDVTIPLALMPLCLYEMAVCFRHGWGIIKSKVMAAYCFSVAARLGDANSQTELANCYLAGMGCKKNKMEAARWLRESHQRGKQHLGETWIWKKKWGGNE